MKRLQRLESGPFPTILMLGALAVGIVVRLGPVMAWDFPLNDGGMFLAMIADVQRARYAFPETTSYNAMAIPFVYPPLGFYLGAVASGVFGISNLEVLRVVPVALSVVGAGAFALLARQLLPSGLAASVATLVFVILPGSFVWQIMGGGLTRALGMLCALLALREAHRFYTNPSRSTWILFVLWSSATIVAHLDWTLFLMVSVLIALLTLGRNVEGLVATALAAISILLITSPWWATSVLRFGVDPFLAASQTGSWVSFLVGDADPALKPLVALLLLLPAAAFAALATMGDRRLLFVGWCCLIVLVDVRAYAQLLTVPTSLAIGFLVSGAPARERRGTVQTTDDAVRRDRSRRALPPISAVLVLFMLGWSLYTNVGFVGDAQRTLVPLPASSRAAMQWVADETPTSSRVLILSVADWHLDQESEWFPALAARRSVATVQGTEWIPGAYWRFQELHALARSCATRESSCLDLWKAATGETFTHVYLVKRPEGDCCATLSTSLARDSRYRLVYDGPGATIFAAD